MLNWLKSGKYRFLILKHLNESPKTPSELSDILKINRASISRILKDLRNKGLVENTTEKAKTVLYILTSKGSDFFKEMENMVKK